MTEGLLGIGALLLLILLRAPIATAMIGVSLVGMVLKLGLVPAVSLVGKSIQSAGFEYALSIIPLFILMGNVIGRSGISEGLYRASYAWIGHKRGGLAAATIIAAGGFAAVCGSSMATAATMGRLAMPEMRKFGYRDGFASASIAAGGTLGVLIPPSLVLMVYGLLTQNDIGLLFIAGIVPGIVGIVGYILAIAVAVYFKPELGPPALRFSWKERLFALSAVGPTLLLFGLILGGIYGKVFTAEEAAGVGACGALLLAVVMRRLGFVEYKLALVESAITTASIFAILIGAVVFTNFVNIVGLPAALQTWMVDLKLPPLAVLGLIAIIFIGLGCILEGISIMLIAVPIFYPIVMSFGYDPIWFGVMITVFSEITFIVPPLGINLLVLRSVIKDLDYADLLRNIGPFIAADVVRVLVLVAFPALVLWLPNMVATK